MDWWNVVRTILMLGGGAWAAWIQHQNRKASIDGDVAKARIGGESKDQTIATLEAKLSERDAQLIELARENAVLTHQMADRMNMPTPDAVYVVPDDTNPGPLTTNETPCLVNESSPHQS